MLNWIGWNRTIYFYNVDLALNNQQIWYVIKPNKHRNQNPRGIIIIIIGKKDTKMDVL